jgi:hypothetical protein
LPTLPTLPTLQTLQTCTNQRSWFGWLTKGDTGAGGGGGASAAQRQANALLDHSLESSRAGKPRSEQEEVQVGRVHAQAGHVAALMLTPGTVWVAGVAVGCCMVADRSARPLLLMRAWSCAHTG